MVQKAERDLPVSVTAAQTMTDCGFWRLVTILLSVVDEEAQTRSFCWFTTCWMFNFFLSVNTRFGSIRWAIFWSIFLHIWTFMVTWLSVSYRRCNILKAFNLRSCLNTWCVVALHRLRCQVSAASARVSSQLFSRVFEELSEADSPLSSAPWSVKGVFGLLELLHDLPHRWTVHIQPFCNFNINFFIFVKLNYCISVYSHYKTNFWEFCYNSLKVKIVSFQTVIILRKFKVLKEFYSKTKIGCFNLWTPGISCIPIFTNLLCLVYICFTNTLLFTDFT